MLSQLQKDNFNHQLLCCLNPEGEVLPGQTVMLEWIFSPIEAKMYQVSDNTGITIIIYSFVFVFFPIHLEIILCEFRVCELSLVCLFPQIEIPIRIEDGDSILVRFEGCGITTPTLGSETPFSGTNMRTYEQLVQRRPFPEQVRTVLVFLLKILNLFC